MNDFDQKIPIDLDEILKTLNADRARMDNYRALLVNRIQGPDYAWWQEKPQLLYRKGNRFRSDTACWFDMSIDPVRPPNDVNLETWWREQVDACIYAPRYITHGNKVFQTKLRWFDDEEGMQHCDIESVKEQIKCGPEGEIFPPYWSLRPEHGCRPPMGIPSSERETSLNYDAAGGLPDMVLLEVRRTVPDPEQTALSHGVQQPDFRRYWLDPARDYMAIRWDGVCLSDSGEEQIISSTVVEQTARSPRGIWYASQYRRVACGRVEHDCLKNLIIDFDHDLPDSLFDLPVAGRIY